MWISKEVNVEEGTLKKKKEVGIQDKKSEIFLRCSFLAIDRHHYFNLGKDRKTLSFGPSHTELTNENFPPISFFPFSAYIVLLLLLLVR